MLSRRPGEADGVTWPLIAKEETEVPSRFLRRLRFQSRTDIEPRGPRLTLLQLRLTGLMGRKDRISCL